MKRLPGLTLWLLAALAVLNLSAQDAGFKKISVEEYRDKVYGSWLAQCIGNVYGLPHENDYIEEPGPEAFPYGYQGNLERLKRTNGVFSDDDTDIEYMYLLAMEKHGPEPTLAELAAMWKYCLAAMRPGNVHSAEDWDELLLPEIERQQAAGKQVAFRGDAVFAKPEIYEALEERGADYAIRIPANKNLELEIEDILFRPPGRPGRKPLVRYKSFRYQAESWKGPRRVVAKVEHHQGELFARVGFIVTNMSLPSRSVVRFYNKRGTAEQWIKEGKQATHWTRLSCHRFRANEVRLQLSVLAYNQRRCCRSESKAGR